MDLYGTAWLRYIEKEIRKSPGISWWDMILKFRIITLTCTKSNSNMRPEYRM